MKWYATEQGSLKLNVDASIHAGATFFFVGMVMIRAVLSKKCLKVEGTLCIFEAETYGITEALSWISHEFAQSVTIESDSLQEVNAINKKVDYQLEVGDLLDESRAMISNMNRVSLNFVKKTNNRVAHMMTRVPCPLHC